jgi:hypothetical protein
MYVFFSCFSSDTKYKIRRSIWNRC